MAKVAQQYLQIDPWLVTENGFHPDRSLVSESVFALANEFMGVRGYFEEGYSGRTEPGSFFNGIFEDEDTHHPAPHIGMALRCHFLANAVDWLHARIKIAGEQLDLAKSKFSEFTRTLDMGAGTMTRSFVWTLKGGKQVRLTFQRFTSMVTPCLAGQRITLEAINFSGMAQVTMGLDFDVVQCTRRKRRLWPTVEMRFSGKTPAIVGRTERTGHRVFSAMHLHAPDDAQIHRTRTDRMIGYNVKIRLAKGKPVSLDKMAVHATEKSPKVSNARFWQRALDLTAQYARMTYDQALSGHMTYWRAQWDMLDVVIEGSPADQQAVRFAIYHLSQIKHGVDSDLNIAAKGLSGEDYEGHTWWDTETYCLPFYLFNNPKAARDLLVWRHARLPQARRRAVEMDLQGARYPMDTIDGTESSRSWQNGDLEIHVPMAVSFGIWHYVLLTQDKEFLYNEGIEMLLEVARFMASRGQWSQTSGGFGFWCVVGPDEFHFAVHNNYYTNILAKKMFEYTLSVIAEMKKEAPVELANAAKKVNLRPREPTNWAKMARKMILLQDKKTGVFEHFENYFDMPHIDCDSIDPADFPLIKHWCYYRIFRWDMIKQPDTLLALFLFSHDYTAAEKLANYEYYEPRCIHESSLSPAIHSILAAEVGKNTLAATYWNHAARLDLDDYNRNTSNGLHTTSMAATWMNVVYGFGGMRSDGKLLSFRPNMPKMWKAFSFKILYRGSILEVAVDKTSATFRVVKGDPLRVEIFDKPCRVADKDLVVALAQK